MKPKSLYQLGQYSLDWVQSFYEQTGIWWGSDPQEEGTHKARVEIIRRLCPAKSLNILDLGTGPGATAAAMADEGHHVTAVEFSSRVEFARQLATKPRQGVMTVLEADFYSVELPQKFNLVTYWDGFGLGTDSDQRRILRRISQDWLKPDGIVLMDVFNPFKAALESGKEVVLNPLKGVPGSVKMVNRTYFDPEQSRWIDEWQPFEHPEQTLAQSLRCYSPPDLVLLLENTGLKLVRVEENGEEIFFSKNQVKRGDSPLVDWSYLVLLEKE